MASPAVGPSGRPVKRRPPARSRCPTLMELATEAVVANIDMCAMASRELWSRLPQAVLLDIYDRLSAQNRLTLEAWSLLSTTLFAKREELRRSVVHNSARISPPPSGGPLDPEPFTLCFGPAWSLDSSFITHLTLDATCALDTPHLLLLPGMPNLGLLRIVEPRSPSTACPRITDRVVRAWAERRDAFPVLRILQLSCCVELTPEILRYLGSFPALVYVTVRALRSNWDRRSAYTTAPKLGWRVAGWPDDVEVLMRRYFASCMGRREGPLGRSEVAAAIVSAGCPAGLSRLFDEDSTVRFGKRPAVLPWDGRAPSNADDTDDGVHAETVKYLGMEEGATGGWAKRVTIPGLGGPDRVESVGAAKDVITDDVKVSKEMPLEDDITVHDNPAWWLYAAIGHVILRDRDLKSTKNLDDAVPTSNGWVLPPLPVLSLTMAAEEPTAINQDGTRRGAEQRDYRLIKYAFARQSAFSGVTSRETPWLPEKAAPPRESMEDGTGAVNAVTRDAPLRQRKRRKMGEVLSSMAGG